LTNVDNTRVLNTEDQDPLRARVAQALGLAGPQKVQRVTLPAMDEQLEPFPEARKALLSSNIDAEFAARKDRTRVPKTPTPLDDASLLAVCGTCRGACCKWGEDHAYLTRAVLSRVKAALRIASDEALVQRYLDKVPAQARKGSCVYHGAEGCALPRSMRSETCNRFVCHPLKQLGQDFGRPGYAQLAVSRGAERADRVLLLSEGETRPLCPED